MPRATKFLKEKYINVDIVDAMDKKARACTVSHVVVRKFRGEQRLVMYLNEHETGLPLNETRIEQMIAIAKGEDDYSAWRGLKLILDVDPSVEYDGKVVGGVVLAKG